nr:hypothetical protein [Tanacetum cinerariifolium]
GEAEAQLDVQVAE